MSRLYSVNSICLRYVVPFLFEGSFEDAFDKVETKKNNERKRKKCLVLCQDLVQIKMRGSAS